MIAKYSEAEKKEPVFFCVRLFQYLKETGERFHMY